MCLCYIIVINKPFKMSTTVLCQFSGLKIYPGHGKRMIRIDNRSFNLLSAKCKALHLAKKNPRKISWTVLYRRKFKKGVQVEVAKRRTRRNQKNAVPSKVLHGLKFWLRETKNLKSEKLRETKLSKQPRQRSNLTQPENPQPEECKNKRLPSNTRVAGPTLLSGDKLIFFTRFFLVQ